MFLSLVWPSRVSHARWVQSTPRAASTNHTCRLPACTTSRQLPPSESEAPRPHSRRPSLRCEPRTARALRHSTAVLYAVNAAGDSARRQNSLASDRGAMRAAAAVGCLHLPALDDLALAYVRAERLVQVGGPRTVKRDGVRTQRTTPRAAEPDTHQPFSLWRHQPGVGALGRCLDWGGSSCARTQPCGGRLTGRQRHRRGHAFPGH